MGHLSGALGTRVLPTTAEQLSRRPPKTLVVSSVVRCNATDPDPTRPRPHEHSAGHDRCRRGPLRLKSPIAQEVAEALPQRGRRIGSVEVLAVLLVVLWIRLAARLSASGAV